MGKSKQKNHKQEEHHLGTIRSQKQEIKRLNQRIKQLEKDLGYRSKAHDEETEEELPPPDCPSCAKGYLRELVVVGRRIFSCQVCSWRSRAIKV